MAKDVIITPADGDIQFQNSSGTNSGKIEQSGDDLVISNAVGDVLLGDGSSDVFVGNGTDNVDIVFEQNGEIRGEVGSTVTLTLGSKETILDITGSGTIHLDGSITGSTINLQSIVNAGTDTDKFLVLDSSGNVDFRTGTQVRSDIGAGTGAGDITSVSGSGNVSGITLSGDHSSGDACLTLGGTFSTTTSSITNFNSGVGTIVDGCGFTTCTGTVTGAAGSNTQVQFNNSGNFGGSSNLTFDGTNLTVGGKVIAQEIVTNIVSQSISFATGSNIFGDEISDTHTFTGSVNVTGSLNLPDNVKANFGDGSDLQIYHDGSDSYIEQSGTGDLIFKTSNAAGDILFKSGSVAFMFMDSSQTAIRMKRLTKWDDNIKATFGDGGDLQIYHDGSNSYIYDGGVGDLNIVATDLNLKAASDELYLTATSNGAVELYHDNSKKFSTTTDGINVVGEVSSSGKLYIGTTDTNTSSTSALVLNGTEVEKRTLGSNAFSSAVIVSESAQIDHDQTTNFSADEHFTQANITTVGTVTAGDVSAILPSGTVSGSGQITGFVQDAGGAARQVAVWADGPRLSGSNDLFFDTANNRLGVGVSSPSDSFQVKSEGADDGIALIKSNNTNQIVKLIETGTGDGALIAKNTSNAQCVLVRAQGSSYLNGGCVGIGTASPDTTLTIGQTADANGLKILGYDDKNGSCVRLNLDASGVIHLTQSLISLLLVRATPFGLYSGFTRIAPLSHTYLSMMSCWIRSSTTSINSGVPYIITSLSPSLLLSSYSSSRNQM